VAGGVHQADIQGALDQASHQILLETDLAADGNIGSGITHPADPAGQKSLPQGNPPANTDRGSVPARQTNIVARLFDRENQGLGMLQEATPGRGQRGAGTVTYEQSDAQIGLQVLDPGTDRGLGYVQPAGGFQKTAVGGDGEEGASLLDVHSGVDILFISVIPIIIFIKYRLSSIKLPSYDASHTSSRRQQ